MEQLRDLSTLSFTQVMQKSEPVWSEIFTHYRDLETDPERIDCLNILCLSVSQIKESPYLMSLFISKLVAQKLPLAVYASDPAVQELLPDFFQLQLDSNNFPNNCSKELLEFILIYLTIQRCIHPVIITKDNCLKFIRKRDRTKETVSDKMAKKLAKYLSTPKTLGTQCSEREREYIHSHWPLLASFQYYFSTDPHFVQKEGVAFQPILLNFWIRYTYSKSNESLFREFLKTLLVPFNSQERPSIQPPPKRRKISPKPPTPASIPTIFSCIAGLNHSLTSLLNHRETHTLLDQLYHIETLNIQGQTSRIELYNAIKKFFSALTASYNLAKKQASLTEIYNQPIYSNSILNTAFLELMIGQTNKELGMNQFKFDEDLTTLFWQENWTELREAMDFKAILSPPNEVEKQIRWIANFETLGDRDQLDELEKLFSQNVIKCNPYDRDSLEKLLTKDQKIAPNLDPSQAKIIFAFYCLKSGIPINRLAQKSWLWARTNKTSIENLLETSVL